MSQNGQRGRAFTFTWNNPPADAGNRLRSCGASYGLYAEERGNATGTRHLQGYIRFGNARTVRSVRRGLPGLHIELAIGSFEQNLEYCSKENEVEEWGERPKQGVRSDLIVIRERVLIDHAPILDIVECRNYQQLRFAEKLRELGPPPTRDVPEVYWFYGKTGTGKTRCAFEETESPWISSRNLKWWQGYDVQKHVIIDDFRRDFCTFHELLRITDRYPFSVEVKGGARWLMATKIIITCPKGPEELWEGHEEDLEQLKRRIKEVRHFNKLG